MHRILFLIFFIQSLSVFANVTYTVVNCNDGDTCKIRSSTNLTLRVRLMAIDAPEVAHDQSPAQSFGYESKIFINQLIKGNNVA